MKRLAILTGLLCLALPVAVGMGADSIQDAVNPYHCYAPQNISVASKATVRTAITNGPWDMIQFIATNACSTKVKSLTVSCISAGWTTVPSLQTFTWAISHIDSIVIYNAGTTTAVYPITKWRR